MKLKKSTILELGQVLKEEFNLDMPYGDLEKLAYCLVNYFSLLEKIENRHEVRK